MSIDYIRPSLQGISGYDFSGITQVMVNNFSLPLNKLNASQSALEAKRNAWRDINTRMAALERTLDKLRDSSTWRATKVTSSNENTLKVSSSPGAMEGVYNIRVEQAALAQTVSSTAHTVAAANTSLGLSAGTISIQPAWQWLLECDNINTLTQRHGEDTQRRGEETQRRALRLDTEEKNEK